MGTFDFRTERPPTKALALQGGGGKWGRERPPAPAGIDVGGGDAQAERKRGLSASRRDKQNAGGLVHVHSLPSTSYEDV